MKNISIIGGILVIAVLLGVGLGCSQLGTKLKFDGGELYYTTNVTADEAQALGNNLVESGFFNGRRISVQLDKSDSTYQFRMVVKPEFRNDKSYAQTLRLFAAQLSSEVFNDEPVEIHICDESFKTLRVVKP
ncbi:MAG TPA: hypothetical protein VF556_18810 [Pyrinomonadaceae bacterium]|jgi:hypothetical protein